MILNISSYTFKAVSFIIFIILLSCNSNRGINDFAEFHIIDISKPAIFIDSVTGRKKTWIDKNHSNVDVIITGELGGWAIITYGSTHKMHEPIWEYKLNKGLVHEIHKDDYYGRDDIWIKFTPQEGCKDGHLTIKTRIN